MRFKQKILASLLVGALLAPAFMQPALAATGVIYITPGSSSLQVGSSETLSLRITPGTTVDGVQATVSYNPGLLQLNSVDTSGSPFTVPLQKSSGGGTITVALGNLSGGVSSDALIATMNFTALATGSASLGVSNANATSSGTYTNPSASGASILLTAPAGSGGGSGGGTTGGSGGSHSSGGTTKTTASAPGSPAAVSTSPTAITPAVGGATTPAAVHLKDQVSSVTLNSATIKITSNQSLVLYIMYGSNQNNLTSKVAAAAASTSTKLTVGQGGTLTPGATYYYQVVAEDAAGNQTKLPVQHFTTTGLTVRVTVLDEHNNVLKHVSVTLHSKAQTVTTNSSGVAVFTGLTPGLHHVTYQAGGKTYSNPVYVENNVSTTSSRTKIPTAAAQNTAVVMPIAVVAHSNTGLIILLIMLGAVICFTFATEITRHFLSVRHVATKLVIAGRSLLF